MKDKHGVKIEGSGSDLLELPTLLIAAQPACKKQRVLNEFYKQELIVRLPFPPNPVIDNFDLNS
jgi:hypothetical protein